MVASIIAHELLIEMRPQAVGDLERGVGSE
jgi:hypothetical protein